MPPVEPLESAWSRPSEAASLGDRVHAKRAALVGGARTWLGPVVSTDYRRMHAERLFPLVQVLIGLGVLYGAAELVVFGFATSIARGLVYLLVVAPAALLLVLAVVRIAFSFLLALVRIADDIEELGELPRWVRGLAPKRMLWSPSALDNRREAPTSKVAGGRRS